MPLLALIARLAALIPPPKRHTVRYFGVLSICLGTVNAVLTSGDINAIYDEQLLNPPPSESVAQLMARKVANWLPRRWAKAINGDGRDA